MDSKIHHSLIFALIINNGKQHCFSVTLITLQYDNVCRFACLGMLQAGASLDKTALETTTKCSTCKMGHPLIIQQYGNEAAFSIFSDGHVIPCGNSVTEAFDFFFKFIWIFNLAYTCGLTHFLKFFEFKIYRLSLSGRTPPTVNEVARLVLLWVLGSD